MKNPAIKTIFIQPTKRHCLLTFIVITKLWVMILLMLQFRLLFTLNHKMIQNIQNLRNCLTSIKQIRAIKIYGLLSLVKIQIGVLAFRLQIIFQRLGALSNHSHNQMVIEHQLFRNIQRSKCLFQVVSLIFEHMQCLHQ